METRETETETIDNNATETKTPAIPTVEELLVKIAELEATVKGMFTFNPYLYLSENQQKHINGRFNKSWITPRQAGIDSLQKQNPGLDYFQACFTYSLMEDADNLILSKKIAKAADAMLDASDGLFGNEPSKDAALHSIQTEYEKIDVIHQPAVGKRFRTLLVKGNTSINASRMLQMITEKLDVREAEWV